MSRSKYSLFLFLFLFLSYKSFCWGFYAHRKINYYAVFLLPPEMMQLYKSNINYLTIHAVDPDKRRYIIKNEGSHHYIDIDHYGKYPYDSLPHNWIKAKQKFSNDTLIKYGILPWWILRTEQRLVTAFKEKNKKDILKLSADLGHYIGDAHVPLHSNTNHNGEQTGQEGIHAFWESRIPELFGDSKWNYFIGKACYIENKDYFIWKIVLQSAAASDTVLNIDKKLSTQFSEWKKYSYEIKNHKLLKQYSTEYTTTYDDLLNHMTERRMRLSIYAIACFWYTAWVDAGQPDLTSLN